MHEDSEQHAQKHSEQYGWGKSRSIAILKENWMPVLRGVILCVVRNRFARRSLQVELPALLHTTLQKGTGGEILVLMLCSWPPFIRHLVPM